MPGLLILQNCMQILQQEVIFANPFDDAHKTNECNFPLLCSQVPKPRGFQGVVMKKFPF